MLIAKLLNIGISRIVIGGLVIATIAGLGIAGWRHRQPTNSQLAVITSSSPRPVVESPVSTVSPTPAPTSTTTASPKSSPAVVKSPSAVTPTATPASAQVSAEPSPIPTKDAKTPPLMLKNVGINLDYYDPATGRAGDLVFTKNKLQFDVLLTEYGFVVPSSMSASGQDKKNPQPTWIAPMGTKVTALVDGVVTAVTKLYSDDYSVMVAEKENSQWMYETEHVINPVVKVGDRVKAGQVVAEVSPHSSQANNGYGMVEIGILYGGQTPQHLCPFAHLDPSVKADIQAKLTALYKSWEEYRGNTALHNEAGQSVPGCLTLDWIEG